MIKTREDYLYYIEADRIAKAIPKSINLRQKLIELIIPNYVWNFQKTLRKVEYFKNCRKGLIASIQYIFIYRRYKMLSYKLGFSIPPNVFGPGLSIAHHGTIVVNSAAKIGANCRLHTCVNIGSKAGYGSQAPQIGNNCYIGPGVKIYGNITIADNIAIGANAIVNKSFIDNNSSIAGIPAKRISEIAIYDILIPATLIIDKGLVKSVDAIFRNNPESITLQIKNLL